MTAAGELCCYAQTGLLTQSVVPIDHAAFSVVAITVDSSYAPLHMARAHAFLQYIPGDNSEQRLFAVLAVVLYIVAHLVFAAPVWGTGRGKVRALVLSD